MNEHVRQDFIMKESTQNEEYIMQCKTNVVQQWCNVAKMMKQMQTQHQYLHNKKWNK
jgi:hypothetical protein